MSPANQGKDKQALVLDTSVVIHDPKCLSRLTSKGSTVIIPWVVLEELDHLKTRPDIGHDAREAIHLLEEMQTHPLVMIATKMNWGKWTCDHKVPDHRIIACALEIRRSGKFEKTVLISKDSMMRVKAREVNLEVEDYEFDQVENGNHQELPRINVAVADVDENGFFPFDPTIHGEIGENAGVVCISGWGGNLRHRDESDEREAFAAIRKGNRFKVIPPTIGAFGIKPYVDPDLNEEVINWEQHVALGQLLDPTIALHFLKGGAGTGKTLLAMAAALEMRHSYRQILISRPMVPLEDEDKMGFLPGDIYEKMDPWLQPIYQTLKFLREKGGKEAAALIDKLQQEHKIEIQPLDYIRGLTLHRQCLIIDEAQNLTPHQIKTIITRAGRYTKIILTGDLGQIDRKRRLDRRSSGLNVAAARFAADPQAAHLAAQITFREALRSPLSRAAVEIL